VCIKPARSTVHQWPAKISAAVSLSRLGGRMEAGREMTGAGLGTCFANGPQGRSRHRLWCCRLRTPAKKRSLAPGFLFCGTKHAKRPKHWPPAVCFTGVQCRLARSGSDAASADAHSTMSTPHTLRARLSLLHSTDAPHLRLVRRAGQLVQARVMTLFGLSAADPRGVLEGVAVLSCTDFWPMLTCTDRDLNADPPAYP